LTTDFPTILLITIILNRLCLLPKDIFSPNLQELIIRMTLSPLNIIIVINSHEYLD
jgi:hypothetical protein